MYWKIDLEELPSRGVFYNAETEIRIRPLNVADMKFLATLNKDNCTKIINELLENVLKLKNLEIDDILLCDRMFMCFWLRANSLIAHNGYTFNIECDKCKNKSEHEITLNDFDTKYIYAFNNKLLLPGCQEEITLKIPTIKDLDFRYPFDEDLEMIGRCIDSIPTVKEKRIFLQNLSALDFAFIKSKINDIDNGFDNIFSFTCPKCGNIQNFKLKITDEGMFSGIHLYDILKRIVSITKYTSMQITNDTPWMELELYMDIVNKMIEEENEQNSKQQSLASSKMNSLKANNHISKPTITKPNIHR